MSTTPHISVVDDDVSVRESLWGFFRSMGFAVDTFASAEEFLSSDASRVCDCIILDFGMPGMSGLDLQRLLKANQSSIPIVFITASDDGDLRSQVLEGGAVAFLVKPFGDEALLNAVQSVFNGRLKSDGE